MTSDLDLNHKRAPAAALVGLFLALLFPLLTTVGVRQILGVEISIARMTTGLAIHWLTLAMLLLIVLRWERRPLQSIGWRAPRWSTAVLGIVAGVAIGVLSGVMGDRLEGPETHVIPLMQALPLLLRVALVITAGVFEEITYRGYGFERVAQYFGGKWIAGAVTVGLFTIAHAPAFGVAHLPSILLAATLMTALYLWRRNLLLNIIAHVTIDAIGLLLVPAMR